MGKKPPEALIKVSEGGTNFKMVDCEFQMGESERPIIETKADGTQIQGATVSTDSKDQSFWKHPLTIWVLGIIGAIIASFIAWKYGFN